MIDNWFPIPKNKEEVEILARARYRQRLAECKENMSWDEFEEYLKYASRFIDVSEYCPCDVVGRQCNMACQYYGEKCGRWEE